MSLGVFEKIQSGASDRSLGFEDENLASFPGRWAAIVATYCPSRLQEGGDAERDQIYLEVLHIYDREITITSHLPPQNTKLL